MDFQAIFARSVGSLLSVALLQTTSAASEKADWGFSQRHNEQINVMFWILRRIPTLHATQTHERVRSPFHVMLVQIVIVEFVPPLRLSARCARVHIVLSAILRVAIERSRISRRLATRADVTCGATENLVLMGLPIV